MVIDGLKGVLVVLLGVSGGVSVVGVNGGDRVLNKFAELELGLLDADESDGD